MIRTRTTSPDATFTLGEALGRALPGGLTIGLVGPLGAGKTHLVKGIASGNAIDDVPKVTSPTFTLIQEYPGRHTLYHVDAYRLPSAKALWELGWRELQRQDCVVIVEWADRVAAIMPADALWVEITPTGEMQREFVIRGTGDAADRCLEALRREPAIFH